MSPIKKPGELAPIVTPETDNSYDGGDTHVGPHNVKLGQWFWVTTEVEWTGQWHDDDGADMKEGDKARWLGCAMEIGSNYVEMHSPHSEHSGHTSERVHFDEFEKRLEFAPDADAHIAGQQVHYKSIVNGALSEIREITARLGVVQTEQITERTGDGQNALVVVSSRADTSAYKKALIKAQEETLPALFKKIEDANRQLARWMSAPTMPLTASIGPLQNNITAIKERVYTIELYAGLTEEAVKCCDGKPAAAHEKLRVMQRRLYMDEECLVNYEAGGMEFKNIDEFDKWISKSENRDRLLSFPRTLAAFRVRRTSKEREHDGNVLRMFVNFRLEEADKKTFLYVRNGDQIWRVDCDFVFDEMIFPNKDQFNPSEPMMVKMRHGEIDEIMPTKRWESLVAEEKERKRLSKVWEKKNPGKHHFDNPHRASMFGSYEGDWEPFDQSSVQFDDALRNIEEQIKRYNRIAVIVQGLFDRSEVLHPHAPVKMWEANSFDRSVELVYDAVTLTFGDKPDFEAYRARLNALIDASSVVTGQEDFWMRREAERENRRIANDYNYRGTPPHYTRFRPYDNEGPGVVGVPTEWKARSHKAVFRWTRESRDWKRPRWDRPEAVKQSIEIPRSELFNISAYKPGDFKQFYADPRTRREYIEWAPFLLTAEDYHAGKKVKRERNNERG